MFCEKCGMQLEEGMVFCPECGNQISSGEKEKKDITGEADVVSVGDDEATIIYEMNSEKKEEINLEKEENTVDNETSESHDEVMQIAPGAIIETSKIKYCHNCGAANAETDAFCYSCGMPLGEKNQTKKQKKFSINKLNKKVMAGFVAITAVVIMTIFIFAFANYDNGKNTLLYLKDNELTRYKKNQVNIIGDEVYEDKDDAYGPYDNISALVSVSENRKYVFYPQNYEDGTFDLYYKKLNDIKSEGEKIDSEVSQYNILKNNKVVYLENSSADKLYISDLMEKEKIASDVGWFKISQDEKNIFWRTSDGDNKIYVCDTAFKNEKIKLDSDVSSLVYISDDLSKIVYLKEDTLYYIENFGDKKKIDSDVSNCYVVKTEKQEEIYYMVEDDESFKFCDMIDDDYALQDAKMTEPDITDYQTIVTKPSYWGMREETVTDDAYYSDLEKYNEKLERDYIREYTGEEVLAENNIVYRYILGDEDSEEYAKGIIMNYNSYAAPVYLYTELDIENVDKIKISKFMEMDNYEAENQIMEMLYDTAKVYMVSDGKKIELDVDFDEYETNIYISAFDENTKECYLTLTPNSDDYQTCLFKTSYGKLDGNLELIAEEFGEIELKSDKGIYYTTELENYVGELYCNDDKVDSDVLSNSVVTLGNGEGILYLTDPDDMNTEGTLKMYMGSESIKIADDVSAYQSNDKGEVAFLVDYNFNKYRGDLKVYKNNKTVSMDTDVTSILYY